MVTVQGVSARGGRGKLTDVLLYTLKQGEHEARIIRQCLRLRRPLPDAIQNAPELDFGLELYWDAFWDLSTCRPVGLGTGPIPWLSIRDYGVTYEFDDEQLDDLFHYVRVMDNAWLQHHAPKKEK